MSLSIEKILADAKCLVERLKEHDASALALSQKTGDLQKDIEARNTYEENIKEFNNAAGHQPRSALILGIQHESNAIRALQNENDELRASLTEHQHALELIMSKYRHQIVQFTESTKVLKSMPCQGNNPLSVSKSEHENNLLQIQMLRDKIYEMACVMQEAASVDENISANMQQHISRLEAENSGLRNLLMITEQSSYGSRLIFDDREQPLETVEAPDEKIESLGFDVVEEPKLTDKDSDDVISECSTVIDFEELSKNEE